MTTASAKAPYDVIVVGSGMGGLATGSILAQVGKKRVLLLEKHFKPGGFTHSFRRKKFEWDVGVHYVGQMQPGTMTRRMMDLVTRRGIQWHPMGTFYDRMMFPNDSFDYPTGQANLRDKLIQKFPEERLAIIRYFKDVRRAQGWMGRWFTSKQYPSLIAKGLTWPGHRLAEMNTAEYMQRFKDPLLRAILTGQWPDFGTPPSQSAFGFHAVVTADYFNGGYYPIGGAKQLATQAIQAIQDAGGDCLINHSVQEIIIKNQCAVGVRAIHQGKEVQFFAPVIVSNAGGANTFSNLVNPSYGSMERERANRCEPGPSAVVLFLGLNDDPRKLGLTDVNYWLFEQLDHDRSFASTGYQTESATQLETVPGAFVSFGSLRNPGQEPHTAQIISIGHFDQWRAYSHLPWKRRGEAYERSKEQMAKRLLEYAYHRLPSLKGLVEYQELSTPLTIEGFTSHRGGMIYGQQCNRARLRENAWQVSTSVRNLFLTGSDVGTPGINGALMAGVMTAGKILGVAGMPRIFAKAYSR